MLAPHLRLCVSGEYPVVNRLKSANNANNANAGIAIRLAFALYVYSRP